MIIGSHVIQYEKVSSTNTVASALLRESNPAEGTVITASYQESGRGQTGNRWESEPGSNLIKENTGYHFYCCDYTISKFYSKRNSAELTIQQNNLCDLF